jgi:hypothetical protein
MADVENGCFTVGVFKDVDWARKGIGALTAARFPPQALTILAVQSPETTALIEGTFNEGCERLEIPGVGAVVAKGALVSALQGGTGDLARLGIARTIRRAGFQAHDGKIFESLAARGGVLVAVQSQSRAADALAILHSYGGGNAAIGAWSGRV